MNGPDSLPLRHVPRLIQRADGGWRCLEHLVPGEEAAEMEWYGFHPVVHHPPTHLLDHPHVVVDTGNQEVGQLEPYPGAVEREYGVEYGLKASSAHALVKKIAIVFQVDVGGVDVRDEVSQRSLFHESGAHEDVPESVLMGDACRVGHVFYVGEWLGVGICQPGAFLLQTEIHELTGRKLVVGDFLRFCLRYFMVLAIAAAQVASRACHGEARAAGMEVVERLFLNRVHSQGAWQAVNHAEKLAALVPAAAAQAGPAIGDAAAMRAELTFNGTAGNFPIISAFFHIP